jgi:hypothetical protein
VVVTRATVRFGRDPLYLLPVGGFSSVFVVTNSLRLRRFRALD